MELNPLVKKMTKRQNTSYALMARRIEAQDSLDDFPTPPWATRALIEHVLGGKKRVTSQVCLEPACGSGHMAKVLSEYFGKVKAADIHPYGYGGVHDFLATPHETNAFDWIITNPPFRLGEDFTLLALKLARRGVAMLTRTVFIESVGRYDRLFSINQPSHVAQFTERVPMVKGRLDRRASTATGYCWLVWDKESSGVRSSYGYLLAAKLWNGRTTMNCPQNWSVVATRGDGQATPSRR
jgi:hypothetical protein